jgi:hypothetical protein
MRKWENGVGDWVMRKMEVDQLNVNRYLLFVIRV